MRKSLVYGLVAIGIMAFFLTACTANTPNNITADATDTPTTADAGSDLFYGVIGGVMKEILRVGLCLLDNFCSPFEVEEVDIEHCIAVTRGTVTIKPNIVLLRFDELQSFSEQEVQEALERFNEIVTLILEVVLEELYGPKVKAFWEIYTPFCKEESPVEPYPTVSPVRIIDFDGSSSTPVSIPSIQIMPDNDYMPPALRTEGPILPPAFRTEEPIWSPPPLVVPIGG